jgi:stalled ribosome alternative rescue factor ArfA
MGLTAKRHEQRRKGEGSHNQARDSSYVSRVPFINFKFQMNNDPFKFQINNDRPEKMK